jgi:hypothetical protein
MQAHQVLEKMPQCIAEETWYIRGLECPGLHVHSPKSVTTGYRKEHG